MRAVKSGSAVICLGVFLLAQAMASVPAFHTWVHHDASDSNHECAATLLLNGQVHSATTEVGVTRNLPVFISQVPARAVDFVSTDVRLLPSRGPPA
jgi:hypothetical protein